MVFGTGGFPAVWRTQKKAPQGKPKAALEGEGGITRTAYQEDVPRVEYALTEFGRSLWPVVQSAHSWGLRYVKGLTEQQAPYTDDARNVYLEEDE